METVLVEKTDHEISTFEYPFGRFDQKTHEFVRQHYRYVMRIGSAVNFNWQPRNGLIYRFNADNFWPNQHNPFTRSRKVYRLGRLITDILRGK